MSEFPDIEHDGYRTAGTNLHRLRAEHRQAEIDLEGLRGVHRSGAYPDGSPSYFDGDLAAAIRADDADCRVPGGM